MPGKELTIAQAAAEAQCSKQYIHAEILRGHIEARKLDPASPNSALLISRRSFDAWLRKRAQPAGGARFSDCQADHGRRALQLRQETRARRTLPTEQPLTAGPPVRRA